MSRQSSHRVVHGPAVLVRWLAVGCAVLALLAIGFGRAATVVAQDATPVPVECDAPALPPGTATPQETGTPGAEVPDVAEEAEPEASPVAGTPADEATTAAAAAAAQNIANCINGGNLEGAAALFTPNFIMEIAGTSNPYDVPASLEGFALVDFQTGDAVTTPDGRVGIEVTYLQSQYQFVHEQWWLVQDGEYWKLDAFDVLTPEPEGDTAVVGVALGAPENEYSVTPNTGSVTASPVLIFQATNGGQEDHELVVFKLPEGADPAGLLDGSIPEDQIEFIGAVGPMAPGETQGLALIGLPPGVYTLTCFIPSPDGTPHIALGMVTTFEVTAPA